MKKLVSVLAISLFAFGYAQETKPAPKATKECCSKDKKNKKECSTKDKKACCSTKKAA